MHAVPLLALAVPSRPVLRPPPLPVKIAGGLFLFATSVPAAEKQRSADLQRLAQSALRNDPRVTMELGPGIEAGGVFASAATPDALCLNFQVQGGNAWAECNAFAAKTGDGLVEGFMRLLDEGGLTLKAAFKAFDLNGDGMLTKEEVIEVLTRKTGQELTQAAAEAKWDEWIAKYDTKKDGKFSYAEFAAAHGAISA